MLEREFILHEFSPSLISYDKLKSTYFLQFSHRHIEYGLSCWNYFEIIGSRLSLICSSGIYLSGWCGGRPEADLEVRQTTAWESKKVIIF